jgi:hypothetical protein
LPKALPATNADAAAAADTAAAEEEFGHGPVEQIRRGQEEVGDGQQPRSTGQDLISDLGDDR